MSETVKQKDSTDRPQVRFVRTRRGDILEIPKYARLGPKPYYLPIWISIEKWLWFPQGVPWGARIWEGPGRPPAVLPHKPGERLEDIYIWDWPKPGYRHAGPRFPSNARPYPSE